MTRAPEQRAAQQAYRAGMSGVTARLTAFGHDMLAQSLTAEHELRTVRMLGWTPGGQRH